MKIDTASASAKPAAALSVSPSGSERFSLLLQQLVDTAAAFKGVVAPQRNHEATPALQSADFPDFQSTVQKFGRR